MHSYFSHDSNARNSEKIIRLRAKHGAEGYGVFFMILERLRDEPDYSSVKDYNMLAFDLRVSSGLVKSVVEDFGLFSFAANGERFYSESFLHRMSIKDEKSEKAKELASRKWGNGNDNENKKKRSERMAEARKKGTHTKSGWEEMLHFFGCCVMCGVSQDEAKIVKDHIIPIYQGGSDGLDNLQPLCQSCNSRKGADNNDYRIDYCVKNACRMPANWEKMPANWEKMPAVKKRKVKKRKVNILNLPSANLESSRNLEIPEKRPDRNILPENERARAENLPEIQKTIENEHFVENSENATLPAAIISAENKSAVVSDFHQNTVDSARAPIPKQKKSKKTELTEVQKTLYHASVSCFESSERTKAILYQDRETTAREMKLIKMLVIRCTNIAPDFPADFLRNVLEHFRIMCNGKLKGKAFFTPRSLITPWIWEQVISSLPKEESPELQEMLRSLFK